MRTRLSALAFCVFSMVETAVSAATATGSSFNVSISLSSTQNSINNTCVSQGLSQSTGAIVRVVCGTNQFVSIEPIPGGPFVGVHGGAFRFTGIEFAPMQQPASIESTTLQQQPLSVGTFSGFGTITSLRILRFDPEADMLEMLVSF